MNQIKLKITKEDLEHPYMNTIGCPIHCAFMRMFPKANVTVAGDYITDRSKGYKESRNIYRFDGKDIYQLIKKKEEFTLTLNPY